MSPTTCCARHDSPAAPTSAHRALRHGGPNTTSLPEDGLGVSFGVTPRQTCPRPEGLGRNLRSKTRWFAGFCNSHQVSHFATFFIDARAEISVAESRVWIKISSLRGERKAGQPLRRARQYKCSLTPKAPWVLLWPLRRSSGALAGPRPDGTRNAFAVCFV